MHINHKIPQPSHFTYTFSKAGMLAYLLTGVVDMQIGKSPYWIQIKYIGQLFDRLGCDRITFHLELKITPGAGRWGANTGDLKEIIEFFTE
jgi:hypothetical protein